MAEIERLAGRPLSNPSHFRVSGVWDALLKGTASPSFFDPTHLEFLPPPPPGVKLLLQRKGARIGAVLGATRVGKSDTMQGPRLASWCTARPDVVYVNGLKDCPAYELLSWNERVNLLLAQVEMKHPSSLDYEKKHGRHGWIAKGNYVLAVDELFMLLRGLDTQSMIMFVTRLFRLFDNGQPTPGSVLFFADTSYFAGALLLSFQEMKGNTARENADCVVRMDHKPLGASDAVGDAKILAEAVLSAMGAPPDEISHLSAVKTPYPVRVFLLAAGMTSPTFNFSAVFEFQMNRDIAFYFEDLMAIVGVLDTTWLEALRQWLCRLRDPEFETYNTPHYFAAPAQLIALAPPALELSTSFILNLALGAGSAPLNIARLERARSLAVGGTIPRISRARRLPLILAERDRLLARQQLGDRLAPLARATAVLLPHILDKGGAASVERSFPSYSAMNLDERAALIDRNPSLIIYAVSISMSHTELGPALGALSALANGAEEPRNVDLMQIKRLAESCAEIGEVELLFELEKCCLFPIINPKTTKQKIN